MSLVCGLAVAAAAASASADSGGELEGRKVIVVPLGGSVPGAGSSTTAKMSERLLSTLRAAGADASMAQSTLEDLLMLNGCSFDQDRCLSGVARTLGVEMMFVGQVSGTDSSDTKLVLRRVERSGVTEHDITLTELKGSPLLDQLGENVAKLYPPLATDEALPPPGGGGGRGDIVTPPPPERDDGGGFSLGRVRGYSWVITGVGLAAAAGGGVFWVMAESKQKDIKKAPADSIEEILALEKLEDDANTQYILGDVLTIGGGVIAAVGIGLIVYQASSGSNADTRDSMAVTPVVTRDGAGVALTWWQ